MVRWADLLAVDRPESENKMGCKRFDCFFERHVGFGVRWQTNCGYPLVLSVATVFLTFTVGFGKRLY